MGKRLLGGVVTGFLLLMGVGMAEAIPVVWSQNGHTYDVVQAPYTAWDDARAQARLRGSGWDLATITSQEEQDFITSLIGPATGGLQEYYIGGTYTNGAWGWVTGETFGFTYWGAGEPNGNYSEPHVALDGRYRVPNWGWNDYTGAGSYFVLGYVAERHSSAPVPEPATLLLFGTGIAGLTMARIRGRKK